MTSHTIVESQGQEGANIQTEPDSLNIKEEFEKIRAALLTDELIKTHKLHDIMEMVAKKVVPLLNMTYPHSGETLERYVALRDEVQSRFKEKRTIAIPEQKPLPITQRIQLLFRKPTMSSQHFPPSLEQ